MGNGRVTNSLLERKPTVIEQQDYRGNAANDNALRAVTVANFSMPHKAGERRVRVVGVVGFEAEVVQVVAEGRK